MARMQNSPLQAVRAKCLDCCCGDPYEVKLCTATRCPLHPFRDGHNPSAQGAGWTEERRAAQNARMTEIRKKQLQAKGEKLRPVG